MEAPTHSFYQGVIAPSIKMGNLIIHQQLGSAAMNMNKTTLSIDPGEITSLAVCDHHNKLIEAFEFKMPYDIEICQRVSRFKREFAQLIDKILKDYKINQVLLEVPYAVGPREIPYLYLRTSSKKKGAVKKNGAVREKEGVNVIDLVKLISTVISIYDVLAEKGCMVITIPATYWLSNKEKFASKKYMTMDLIDFHRFNFIKASRDGVLDATLMNCRYNRDWNLQHRVNCFMNADFSNRK